MWKNLKARAMGLVNNVPRAMSKENFNRSRSIYLWQAKTIEAFAA